MENLTKNMTGIYGGTFDPIHKGHLLCAQAVFEKYKLNGLYFVVANKPNFKQNQNVTPVLDRLIMTKLALQDFNNDKFTVNDLELDRKGISYTSETLKLLHKKNNNLVFICGSDAASSIDKWHNPEEIFKYAKVVTVLRRGINQVDTKNIDPRIDVITASVPDVSSSEIRAHKKTNMLTESVKEYIYNKHLYGF